MRVIEDIEQTYKAALKAHDSRTVDAMRMVKARIKQYQIDQRVPVEIPDDVARQVIATYVKQLAKAIPEFEKGGAAGQERIEALRHEISLLERFLPQLLDEPLTRQIVAQAVEELGRPPLQKSGMVIGRIMKDHRGEVDPVLVRRLVEEALGG
ncbi:MAG: GatB/YqeY domain-containing protein [Candidatus Eisenbacteria bacterium]